MSCKGFNIIWFSSCFMSRVNVCYRYVIRSRLWFFAERHMQRISRLLQASMFLDYMWQKMRVTGSKDRWADLSLTLLRYFSPNRIHVLRTRIVLQYFHIITVFIFIHHDGNWNDIWALTFHRHKLPFCHTRNKEQVFLFLLQHFYVSIYY